MSGVYRIVYMIGMSVGFILAFPYFFIRRIVNLTIIGFINQIRQMDDDNE